MIVVYIAGSYRANTEIGVLRNIQRAEEAAIEVWKLGCVALCPHKNSAHLGGVVDDEVFVAGGLELLKRSDAVLMLVGSHASKGATEEYRIATAEKPVFYSIEALRDWLSRLRSP
jgi:hypothetical protein